MDGVATPIIGRPRPLPGHDTPNPAYHPHTLNYEEPDTIARDFLGIDEAGEASWWSAGEESLPPALLRSLAHCRELRE